MINSNNNIDKLKYASNQLILQDNYNNKEINLRVLLKLL
jgi:hypothetical protein